MMDAKTCDGITLAINSHGILFKKAVRRALEQIPNITIIGEEYPVKGCNGSQIDLLVQYQTDNLTLFAIIECKRAYATQKKWIFFESPDNRTKLPYFFKNKDLLACDGKSYLDNGLHLCIEGIEIDTSKCTKTVNDAFKAGSVDKIWQTANQVCRGCHGFLMAELNNRKKIANTSPADFYIVPLIITTAQLFLCPIEYQNADLLTGNSIGNIHLKSTPYVILNHAFTPNHVHLGIDPPNYQNPIDRKTHAQEGIFIVSSEFIKDFFNTIGMITSPLALS